MEMNKPSPPPRLKRAWALKLDTTPEGKAGLILLHFLAHPKRKQSERFAQHCPFPQAYLDTQLDTSEALEVLPRLAWCGSCVEPWVVSPSMIPRTKCSFSKHGNLRMTGPHLSSPSSKYHWMIIVRGNLLLLSQGST